MADRAVVLLDNAAYFAAAHDAMLRARHSIRLVGWTFDPRTQLLPQDHGRPTAIAELLRRLGHERPELDIRLLIWKATALSAVARGLFPLRGGQWFRDSGVTFRADGALPFGAAQHQKLLVIDDKVAFCSNDDFTTNRWDRQRHPDRHRDRRLPSGRIAPPWHGTTLLLDGPAARRLGELCRERWRQVTGEALDPAPEDDGDPWPAAVEPTLHDMPAQVVTAAPLRPEARPGESERSFLRAIAAARRSLYIEAAYLAAPSIREALAQRLAEADGPEIVVISGKHAASAFDRLTMDPQREVSLRRLRAADRHSRLHAFMPLAPHGRPVKVHSKLMIVDDRILRLGSSNLANRSLGYDMECDVVTEVAPGDDRARAIAALRHHLIAHFLGVETEDVAAAERAAGSIGGGIRRLDPGGARLRRFEDEPTRSAGPLARFHIGDPEGPDDAWRPWRRRP